MINWIVQFKNKSFWLALIPAILILIQVIAAAFGYQMDLGELGNRLIAMVNVLFAVIAIQGIAKNLHPRREFQIVCRQWTILNQKSKNYLCNRKQLLVEDEFLYK